MSPRGVQVAVRVRAWASRSSRPPGGPSGRGLATAFSPRRRVSISLRRPEMGAGEVGPQGLLYPGVVYGVAD